MTGWMDSGFLIFQMRPLKGSAQRMALRSLVRSVSTARKPLPWGFLGPGGEASKSCCSVSARVSGHRTRISHTTFNVWSSMECIRSGYQLRSITCSRLLTLIATERQGSEAMWFIIEYDICLADTLDAPASLPKDWPHRRQRLPLG